MSPTQPSGMRRKVEHESPLLVVGWNEDAGNLGRGVTGYLARNLGAEQFAEIEPEDFFSLGGVTIRGDVAQFPESRFYAPRSGGLVVFQSHAPSSEWYRFLDSVLEVAERHFDIKQLCAVGGMITLSSHTAPRRLIAVGNSPETKKTMTGYELDSDVDFETPPGQKPTLNSFLLWVARRRKIEGLGLWVPVPFYMAGIDDLQAQRRIVAFLDERFHLGIGFGDLDREIHKQNEKLSEGRSLFPQIDDCIGRLESNLRLSEEESERLVERVEELLRESD